MSRVEHRYPDKGLCAACGQLPVILPRCISMLKMVTTLFQPTPSLHFWFSLKNEDYKSPNERKEEKVRSFRFESVRMRKNEESSQFRIPVCSVLRFSRMPCGVARGIFGPWGRVLEQWVRHFYVAGLKQTRKKHTQSIKPLSTVINVRIFNGAPLASPVHLY